MNGALSIIFRILAAVVSLYTLLCFIRIILTWIPSLSYSKFTRFLASICDPYLNLFHGIRWLVFGSFDFSPAVALCLLGAASTLLSNFSHQGYFSLGMILAMILSLIWSIISSLLVFFIILLIIRAIMLASNRNGYSGSLLDQVDRSITPIVYRIACTFSAKKNMSYKKALIISTVVLVIILAAGTVLINYLSTLIQGIPF